jgi:hypothetical protein
MRTRSLITKTTNPNTVAGRLRTACAARILALLLTLPSAARAQNFTDIGAGLPGVMNYGDSTSSAACGDYNNDGYLDILLTGYNRRNPFISDSVAISRVYRNNGNGTFTDINAGLPGVENGSVAWGDYDNDGALDILITGFAGVSIREIARIYRNNGNGTFTDINAGLPGVEEGSVAWGDYDNDGALDILITGRSGSTTISRVYRNNGNGTFIDVNAELPGVERGSGTWGDYDNDGYMDLLLVGCLNTWGFPVFSGVYHNDGNGHFTWNTNAVLPGVDDATAAWGDFDNDGSLDILLEGWLGGGGGMGGVYRNNGNGTFTDTGAQMSTSDCPAVLGDFDNDGYLDVLQTGLGASWIHRNNRNGTFTTIFVGLPAASQSSAACGDFDKDGDLDVLLTSYVGSDPFDPQDFSRVYRNNIAVSNTPPTPPSGLTASITGERGVTLRWNPASDMQTPVAGLTYRVGVGTVPGGSNIVSAQSGNAQHGLFAVLTNLSVGIYYWSVQAVDTAFACSAFAAEGTFCVGLPTIILQPSGRTNVVGTTATFTVTANGTAPLAYQWRKAGTNLANTAYVSGATTTNLSITSIQLTDAGSYSVVVTNAYGSVTSSMAVLTISAFQPVPYTYATNNGTITITKYTGSGGAVTIPSTINGLPVTSIGIGAFRSCASLTSVTIPDSVTGIGSDAFNYCSSLTAITVGALNFNYSSLDGVLFNKNQTTLIQCPGGKAGNYTVPNSVIGIGWGAFSWCASLTNISIPNSVTGIGGDAFMSCTSLTSVMIGNSVTSIGYRAFMSCTSLTSVTIPNSVTSIGDMAFSSCSSLSVITVGVLNSFYSSFDGVLFNKSQTTLIQCPEGKAGSYTVPNSVTSIGDMAFSSCSSLASVTIPGSVTSIGYEAFAGCSNLASVTIPNSVISIGSSAFAGCWSLTAITVGALNFNYSSLDGVLFNKSQTALIQCPGAIAGSYAVPHTVTSIGDFAFASCANLTSITIPNSVTAIGTWAFVYCTNLTSVKLSNSLNSIAQAAFYGCYNLASVTIPGSVTNIGSHAFFSCSGLTTVTIPNSVTSIGVYAFYNCFRLTGAYFQGNAPISDYTVFSQDHNVVYYLPGTTGWGSTFGGRPTALWFLPNPLILTGPSFGVQTNGFGFIIAWATNVPVVVEACTNLANHAWYPVGTNTLTNGWSYFREPNWTDYAARIYRIRSP